MAQLPVRQIRLRTFTTEYLNNTSGSRGDVYYDITADTLRVFAGNGNGGSALARGDLANVSTAVFASKAAASGIGTGLSSNNDISISVSNADSSLYSWNFSNTGNLILPSNTSIIGNGDVTISGRDVPLGGSGATGSVTIRGGIDSSNLPVVQDRVNINDVYIQDATIGQDDPEATLNVYSAFEMELSTAGGGIRIEVGASFGAGEDIVILAGAAGEVGRGGDLLLTAGNSAYDAEVNPRGGDVYVSAGIGLSGNGGDVHVTGGDGAGGFNAGIVYVESGNKTWTFDDAGKITLPAGGILNIKGSAPTNSYGQSGDVAGMTAFDNNYFYYCTANYVNNVTNIWKRVAFNLTSW